MSEQFTVKNTRGSLKLIPYIGCKAGFSHIFDALIPDDYGESIYDVFGGGGGFTFYACNRFGSRNVTYNDHNPIITNLIKNLKSDPDGLYHEYQEHYRRSSPEYYTNLRKSDIGDGLQGAGRFLYLTKNAFSGKIRFNSKNEFNTPMRKNAKCPRIDIESIRYLGGMIADLTITNKDFTTYEDVSEGFVYLDPPYMNNPNAHYNAVVSMEDFVSFVKKIQTANNKIMISEQNSPEILKLGSDYAVYGIQLKRSLQYFTKNTSSEIIAINYHPPKEA